MDVAYLAARTEPSRAEPSHMSCHDLFRLAAVLIDARFRVSPNGTHQTRDENEDGREESGRVAVRLVSSMNPSQCILFVSRRAC